MPHIEEWVEPLKAAPVLVYSGDLGFLDYLEASIRLAGQSCRCWVSIAHGGSGVGVRGWLGSSLVVGITLH